MYKPSGIKKVIMKLAVRRGSSKTFCPSEVARALETENWRVHMDEVRKAAFKLREEDKIVIEQQGERRSGKEISGPIRLRLAEQESN